MHRFSAPDGTELAFTDTGTGFPILCLSGLTRDRRDFEYVAPCLEGYRMICLDYRGRGASNWAPYETYTIPVEAQDTVALLDHLGLAQAAILGTSRGGLIAMLLAATAKDRLAGVCLNDIGPEIAADGLADISGYLGKVPPQKSFAEMAPVRAARLPGFENVPMERWEAEVRKHFVETDAGLGLTYDPKLRDAVLESSAAPAADAWPLFDALAGLPLALIRGANSNLLSLETAQEMQRRRPDMIWRDVPDRGHVPFLDEPDAVAVLREWLERLPA
ncbi:MAG: alpha/beta hydrolase [Pseudomonadota bacterium]